MAGLTVTPDYPVH